MKIQVTVLNYLGAIKGFVELKEGTSLEDANLACEELWEAGDHLTNLRLTDGDGGFTCFTAAALQNAIFNFKVIE